MGGDTRMVASFDNMPLNSEGCGFAGQPPLDPRDQNTYTCSPSKYPAISSCVSTFATTLVVWFKTDPPALDSSTIETSTVGATGAGGGGGEGPLDSMLIQAKNMVTPIASNAQNHAMLL